MKKNEKKITIYGGCCHSLDVGCLLVLLLLVLVVVSIFHVASFVTETFDVDFVFSGKALVSAKTLMSFGALENCVCDKAIFHVHVLKVW